MVNRPNVFGVFDVVEGESVDALRGQWNPFGVFSENFIRVAIQAECFAVVFRYVSLPRYMVDMKTLAPVTREVLFLDRCPSPKLWEY